MNRKYEFLIEFDGGETYRHTAEGDHVVLAVARLMWELDATHNPAWDAQAVREVHWKEVDDGPSA